MLGVAVEEEITDTELLVPDADLLAATTVDEPVEVDSVVGETLAGDGDEVVVLIVVGGSEVLVGVRDVLSVEGPVEDETLLTEFVDGPFVNVDKVVKMDGSCPTALQVTFPTIDATAPSSKVVVSFTFPNCSATQAVMVCFYQMIREANYEF